MEVEEFFNLKVGDYFVVLGKLKEVVSHHFDTGTCIEPITVDQNGVRYGMDVYTAHLARKVTAEEAAEIKIKLQKKKEEDEKKADVIRRRNSNVD